MDHAKSERMARMEESARRNEQQCWETKSALETLRVTSEMLEHRVDLNGRDTRAALFFLYGRVGWLEGALGRLVGTVSRLEDAVARLEDAVGSSDDQGAPFGQRFARRNNDPPSVRDAEPGPAQPTKRRD